MKNSIIITSIFAPTEAVEGFARQPDYSLTVVGDKKSPADWAHPGVTYLSVDDQGALPYELGRVLPFNHYCRKMLGYLDAIGKGATMIVDTDDDNIPKEGWAFPQMSGRYDTISGKDGFVNIYSLYADQPIWPRGLPLNKVLDPAVRLTAADCKPQDIRVGIWQGLADEDPDVDAIYRLVNNEVCYFKERPPVVLGQGVLSPFNSQNTAIRQELFPLLYLPTYVTFRFTDILRGLVAQPIMWLHDYHLGFIDATVVQKRNPHNYMKDFESEVPMFLHTEKVIELTNAAIRKEETVSGNLHNAYAALEGAGIVTRNEMITLEAWLNDLQQLSGENK